MEDQVIEAILFGGAFQAQVTVECGLTQQFPNSLAQRRQLCGIERLQLGVFVEELLETSHVVIDVRSRHRWQEVIDHDGVSPALGLGPLAWVVHHKGIEQRHVSDGNIGPARRRESQSLAREPFQGPVLAQMHDGIGPPDLVEPMVEGEVVMDRRQVG